VKRLALLLACLLLATAAGATDVRVRAVDAIGMTVSDLDHSLDFYSRILGFTPVKEVEVAGEAWERLRGVFPLRMRVVRLQLGGEFLELTEYLAPAGRPAPPDARSNDRWFQHVAIVVRDEKLGQARPVAIPGHELGFARGVTVRDPDGHALEMVEP